MKKSKEPARPPTNKMENSTLKAGQGSATGAEKTTVEKHKVTFKEQYGTFSDKPSENITKFIERAERYQKAHMIPSLEMASVIITCIQGEPATKVQRMLTAPGEDYVNADHFAEQEEQKAIKYTPYKPRIEAKKEIKSTTSGEILQAEVFAKDAEPTIYPIRYQPMVPKDKCLKFYLLDLYDKRINLTDADKFLATFKTQKPRQTCSNFMDEFAINYDNYASMKWSVKELKGVPHRDATTTEAEVIGVESNLKMRQAEMLRLVADGLCSEFKTHCDNTLFELTTKAYIQIEKQVMYWQRSTTTGKKFVASCILAKPTSTATVASVEFDEYLDKTEDEDNTYESFTSATQSTQQPTRGQGGGRGRGFSRGNRGRGGRGRGASTGSVQRPQIVSRDIEDGNHPNYRQTQDGQLQKSSTGYPLCNYCGGPSHKRQNCPVKQHDRTAGNKRITHPDRDKGTTVHDKIKKQEPARTAFTTMSPIQLQRSHPWQHNPWPQQTTAAVTYQDQKTAQDSHVFQQEQNQLGPIGAPMQNFHHNSSATTMTPNHHTQPIPCPYQACHAVFADVNQVQSHMNQFHTLPTLARGSGAEQ